MKILVRATNWIGDAVMSLPALRAIRERFPEALVSMLARPWVLSLYDAEPGIRELIPLPDARDWSATWRLIGRLRREHFDLAVLFPNSFSSAAVVRLAAVKRVIGYARDGRSPLLTGPIAVPRKGEIPAHERTYYLELLRRAGLIDQLPAVQEIRLAGLSAARARGAVAFEKQGLTLPVIGVSPGAAYGTAKRWLPERFAEAALRLAEPARASVAVFGALSEQALCEQVALAAGGRNFAGATTLREFIDMTAACSLFLSNDSGAMHLAAACGTPSVTVFGPTDEDATGPSGVLARIVREPVDCAPCLLRECPIDHRCMTRVTTRRVILAAEELLEARKQGPERC